MARTGIIGKTAPPNVIDQQRAETGCLPARRAARLNSVDTIMGAS
ncbi:hypothetical protein ABIE78_002922 [Sinorhizobium fredii]|uniref:Uncharacterized protein n=1 Tax=Sinorhizobium fredii (strain USDA 257) TaxID=1185652 RepID=I3X5W1_SINF2|nr:hypothetical protein [Sinorhizobium fredii]AFL51267.1 hypothetical protein USDA257_c26930 [Sinorhizobium fredii USDA 257]